MDLELGLVKKSGGKGVQHLSMPGPQKKLACKVVPSGHAPKDATGTGANIIASTSISERRKVFILKL